MITRGSFPRDRSKVRSVAEDKAASPAKHRSQETEPTDYRPKCQRNNGEGDRKRWSPPFDGHQADDDKEREPYEEEIDHGRKANQDQDPHKDVCLEPTSGMPQHQTRAIVDEHPFGKLLPHVLGPARDDQNAEARGYE
jgi:hypothetical protein